MYAATARRWSTVGTFGAALAESVGGRCDDSAAADGFLVFLLVGLVLLFVSRLVSLPRLPFGLLTTAGVFVVLGLLLLLLVFVGHLGQQLGEFTLLLSDLWQE